MKNIGKKAVALTLSVSMLSAMCVTANAANNSVSVTLDGKKIETAAYVDSSNRTQVPVEMAVQIGLSYSQDGDQATFVKGTEELTLQNSSAGYVTLRSLAEYFGYQLTWDGDSRTAVLVSPDSEAVDFDSIRSLEIDYSQASQLPLTGYYTKSFEDGRSVKVYIAEEASIRSYFTVVAVPDGVNTKQFLEDEGWIALADQKGEGLFVLEPGTNGWGSAQEESEYLEEAIGFLKKGANANGVGVFSTFGEFYLVGYEGGAAALELWAAANPLFVISQVYLDGESLGQAALNEAGAKVYDGANTGGYQAISDLEGTLSRTGMSQIANRDIPVPTWFVNYSGETASVSYWKTANDCASNAVNGVYYQNKNSDAYQTAYANSQLSASAQYGISQVKVTSDQPNAQTIYDFLSIYTRYDNTFAYSNALAYRLDYTAARVGAQKQAAAGKAIATYQGEDYQGNAQPVELWGKSDVTISGHGTVQVGVFTFSDNNEDGKNDPREYLVYIPEGYQGQELPVLYVYPGNTQTDGIFFDCTQWYQLADSEGIVLVFVNETYSSPVAITHVDAIYYQTAMMTILENVIDGQYADLDFSRVYGTGQSLGSMTTQGFARSNPEFFAAVASTSGIMDMGFEDSGEPIPTYLTVGQSDLPFLLPDLASADNLPDWANYFMEVNGLNTTVGAASDNYGASEHQFLEKRYDTYTWNNEQGIPMLQYGQTLMRTHNCYPGEMHLLWEYLEHFSFEKAADGTVTRYYSASAFEKDDAVVIK